LDVVQTITATTYNLAASAAAGVLHLGGSTTVTATITNAGTGIADGLDYSGLNLTASAGSLGGAGLPKNGGPLAQAASDSGSLTFVAGVPGTFTLTPLASGTNAAIGGPAAQGTVSGATISVFNGNGAWNGSSGSLWSGSGNWADAEGVQAAPGTFAAFAASDTATFSGSGSVTKISLNGANPSLAALVFSGTNYTLSDGTLTMAANAAVPAIVVSDSTTQTISSSIAGTQGLLKEGPGKLVLSGTNSYTGDTSVTGGRLVVMDSAALADGSDLAVGNFLYVNPVSPAGEAAALTAATITPVPEPGTLALITLGVCTALVSRRFRWSRARRLAGRCG
jgi:fibronectin-binding autotransporter adhesin